MTEIYYYLRLSNFIPILIISIISIIFISVGLIFLIRLIKAKANLFKFFVVYIVFLLCLCAGLYAFGTVAVGMYFQVNEIVIPYHNGNYEIVEGCVENLYIEDYNREIRFSVNDVEFEYSPNIIGTVGYNGNSNEVIQEGDVLRIEYINYSNNVIMKIEKENTE